MSKCRECGCVHGPGNTNTLCPLASNYRAPSQAAGPIGAKGAAGWSSDPVVAVSQLAPRALAAEAVIERVRNMQMFNVPGVGLCASEESLRAALSPAPAQAAEPEPDPVAMSRALQLLEARCAELEELLSMAGEGKGMAETARAALQARVAEAVKMLAPFVVANGGPVSLALEVLRGK